MEHSILCTNQARANGIIVDDVPPMVDVTNSTKCAIIIPQKGIKLPLYMYGPVSNLHVRYPTDWDLDNCPHIDLTFVESLWDPNIFNATRDIDSVTMYQDPIVASMMMCDFAEKLQNTVQVNSLAQATPMSLLTPEFVSQLWSIGLEQASRTLRCTTHNSIRLLDGVVSRRVKTRAHQRMYNQLGGYLGRFASDTFKSKVVSLRSNTCVQLFTNRGNYTKSYPMTARRDAPQALDRFLHEVGIPSELLTDNISELKQGDWNKLCKRHYSRNLLGRNMLSS